MTAVVVSPQLSSCENREETKRGFQTTGPSQFPYFIINHILDLRWTTNSIPSAVIKDIPVSYFSSSLAGAGTPEGLLTDRHAILLEIITVTIS